MRKVLLLTVFALIHFNVGAAQEPNRSGKHTPQDATKAMSSTETNSNTARVITRALEPLLPCESGNDPKVWVLKARDGYNIQVAIECLDGVLTARWPDAQIEEKAAP
jgi:hypothetical protein